jgi:hypothetical protein
MQLLIAMANEPAPRVRDVAPQVSERVAAIIDRALAFRREDRYPTAAEMRRDVLAALEATGGTEAFGPVSVRTSPRTTRTSQRELESPGTEPAPSPEPDDDSSVLRAVIPRRSSWTLPLAGATLLTAGFITYASRRGHFEEVEPDQDARGELTEARDAGPDAKAAHAHPRVMATGKAPTKPSSSAPKKSAPQAPSAPKTR